MGPRKRHCVGQRAMRGLGQVTLLILPSRPVSSSTVSRILMDTPSPSISEQCFDFDDEEWFINPNPDRLQQWTSDHSDPWGPYRHLAMELIYLCRFFVQSHEQSLNYSVRLRKWCHFALPLLFPIQMTLNLKRVLIAADDA